MPKNGLFAYPIVLIVVAIRRHVRGIEEQGKRISNKEQGLVIVEGGGEG